PPEGTVAVSRNYLHGSRGGELPVRRMIADSGGPPFAGPASQMRKPMSKPVRLDQAASLPADLRGRLHEFRSVVQQASDCRQFLFDQHGRLAAFIKEL